MNKFKFSPALLCAVLFLTVAAHAQIKTESAPPPVGIELPKPKREFKPILKPGEATRETEATETQTSQQTYVRPSKDARVKRYISDAFGVPAVIGSTFGATVNQVGNNPPEWERNIGGFGKRFASSYGTNVIRNSVSFGLSERAGKRLANASNTLFSAVTRRARATASAFPIFRM